MNKFPSWHLVQLTPEAALEHDRRVYKCGPDVGLGWTPYTYRATFGAVSYWACHNETELQSRLKQHGLEIDRWTDWRSGIRTTYPRKVA